MKMLFYSKKHVIGTIVFTTFISNALAQSSNTNTECTMGSDATPGATVYYDPTDSDDFGIYFQSGGSCDDGSYGLVSLRDDSKTLGICDVVPLDGAVHLIDCAGLVRGQLPEGAYTLVVDMGVAMAYTDFNIVHVQETETADTPTQTATVTPTITSTSTFLTTLTKTKTKAQSTIQSPAPASTYTSTFTPTTKTVSITSITTFTTIIPTHRVTQVTLTQRTKCVIPTVVAIPMTRGRNRGWKRDGDIVEILPMESKHLVKRQTNQGEGFAGTTLTTTITPPVTIVTSSARAVRTSITILDEAPDTTRTVAASPPTVTVYNLAATTTVTYTASQSTTTRTKQTWSLSTITSTTILTRTATAMVTPVCLFDPHTAAVQRVNSKDIHFGWSTRRYNTASRW